MARRVRISAPEARRIALAAQGFDRVRPACKPDVRHFRRVLDTLGLLQLDFVNVLMPAHYLVLWSRLGAYDRQRFDRFVYGCGDYTEQWAHEASIVPAGHWRLLAHRRAGYEPYKNSPIMRLRNRKAYLAEVLEQVRDHGPLTSRDLPPVPGPKRKPGDWCRSVPRWALEYHFGRGALAVTRRLPSFQRVYDLADYYRMSPRDASPLIEELVEQGALDAVTVDGWQEPAYLHPRARSPRRISGASLLSPFDPVIWFRQRISKRAETKRLRSMRLFASFTRSRNGCNSARSRSDAATHFHDNSGERFERG